MKTIRIQIRTPASGYALRTALATSPSHWSPEVRGHLPRLGATWAWLQYLPDITCVSPDYHHGIGPKTEIANSLRLLVTVMLACTLHSAFASCLFSYKLNPTRTICALFLTSVLWCTQHGSLEAFKPWMRPGLLLKMLQEELLPTPRKPRMRILCIFEKNHFSFLRLLAAVNTML